MLSFEEDEGSASEEEKKEANFIQALPGKKVMVTFSL